MSEQRQYTTTAHVARRVWDELDPERRRGDPSNGSACIGRETGRGVVFVACDVVDDFPLFPLGQVVMTQGSRTRLEAADLDPGRTYMQLLVRHVGGDWGILPIEDHEHNDAALKRGYRLFSAYDLYGERYWLITEADRSATTLLLPEEY